MSETNPNKLLNSLQQYLRDASGKINLPLSWLTLFLYELMINGLSPGDLEGQIKKLNDLVVRIESGEKIDEIHYTNGWLAQYAEFSAERLLKIAEAMKNGIKS